MTALGGVAVPSRRPFNMDHAVTQIMCLAANKRAARPTPTTGPILARLFSIGDFPEPSPEWRAADQALRAFANELAADGGGMERMLGVYDEAVERHGYHAVAGVSASWDGCNGWWH